MQGFNRWMTSMMMLIATASASSPQRTTEKLTAYLTDQANVDPCLKSTAKAQAQQIFARYGISLRWKDGRRPAPHFDGSIGIELVHNAPSLDLATAHALARAKMTEGVSIAVFWDRIRYKHHAAAVLAHVFVHEITHLLQGVPRHSETGIMKGNWNRLDFAAMVPGEKQGVEPLQFETEDLELIREGLANRRARAGAASDSMLRKVGE